LELTKASAMAHTVDCAPLVGLMARARRLIITTTYRPAWTHSSGSGHNDGAKVRPVARVKEAFETERLVVLCAVGEVRAFGEMRGPAENGWDTSRRAKAGPWIRPAARGCSYTPPKESG
jgi:hypothetical protein